MRSKVFDNSIRILVVVALGIAAALYSESMVEKTAPPSVLFEALALNHDMPTIKKPKYRSPIAMVPSPDESRIYICEQSAKRIAIFDVAGAAIAGYILLPNEVTGCAVSPDGGTLYATCGSELWPSGMVCVVNLTSNLVENRIPVGHYPRSPILTPDGTKLFVCNMFSNDLSVIDVASRSEEKRVAVVREPYECAITPDGKTLVIGNSLPDDRSTDTMFVSCMISLFDVATSKIDTSIRLTRGSHSVFGVTVSPDGKYAFASHLIGKFNLIGTTVEKGWLHTNNLAVIDIPQKKFVNDVCLDLASVGLGNPWQVRCTNMGDSTQEYMVVAHAGANELSIIHLQSFIDTVLSWSARPDPKARDMQQVFTPLLKSRRRVTVKTKGPRAIAIINNLNNPAKDPSVYTAGYFDDQEGRMEEFTISLNTTRPLETHMIGAPQAWTGERHGESNYYDAALCFQKWQSCHSCHPLTRPDALNWILGGGAVVAPKNAKSMLYSWWTPPTTWTGRRGHAQSSIAAGIELELFRKATTDLSVPLDTFFMYLKPMSSPNLVKGRLSAAAQRGRAIYYNKGKVDCIVCHPPPLFTDNQPYNTALPDPYDANTQWITPHLIEAWRTNPYGHLGSYYGMREILEMPGHSNAYSKLSFEEMDDLVKYVLSL